MDPWSHRRRKGRRGTLSYRAGEVEEESSPLHKRVQSLYLLSSFYVSNNLGQTFFPPFFFSFNTPPHLVTSLVAISLRLLLCTWERSTELADESSGRSFNVRLNTHLRISWEKTKPLQRRLCHAVSVEILFYHLAFHAQVVSSSLRPLSFFLKSLFFRQHFCTVSCVTLVFHRAFQDKIYFL